MSIIKNRLREIREKAGISQMELSKLSGVSRTTIGKIEDDDEVSLRTETIESLAKALEVKVTDIFIF